MTSFMSFDDCQTIYVGQSALHSKLIQDVDHHVLAILGSRMRAVMVEDKPQIMTSPSIITQTQEQRQSDPFRCASR